MHESDHEARKIREAIASLSAIKQARRFDSALEARVTAHVRRRLAEGATLTSIRKALDISEPTVARFLRRARTSALVSVAVKAERAPLVLRGPCGITVTGDVDELAALIARLACSA
jgi:hypothetical protein